MTTTYELVQYYVDLLIIQYSGLPRARATIQTVVTPAIMPQQSVQTITFPEIPTSGSFVVEYEGDLITINWNDSAATIQSKLQGVAPVQYNGGNAATTSWPRKITGGGAGTTIFMQEIIGGNASGFGLSDITVVGSIASGLLTLTFVGVTPPSAPIIVDSSTLMASGMLITPIAEETDLTLPLAVQAGFNLIGSNIAVGVQLDILGKYVGVSRTGNGFTSQVTLDDADFLTLIQLAIIENSSGSSLAQIQALLNQFFPGEVLVFDYQNMQMSYLISTSFGSQNLIQLVVTEGFLPKPMGVQLSSVIYTPTITDFFGFGTYDIPAFNCEPFNTYDTYNTTWPWLVYADSVN